MFPPLETLPDPPPPQEPTPGVIAATIRADSTARRQRERTPNNASPAGSRRANAIAGAVRPRVVWGPFAAKAAACKFAVNVTGVPPARLTGEGCKVHQICDGVEQETTIALENPVVAVSVPVTEALLPAVMVTEFALREPLKSAIQKGKE